MKIENTLYIMNIDILEDQAQFDLWYDKMPDFRKRKIDAIKPHRSKLLSLGAGILLDTAMTDAGISSYEIELLENEKPRIKGMRDVFFNISHSGEVVCLGISDKEIGVDIEKVKHFKESLVNYVFMPQDQDLAKELMESESDKDKVYTRLWTVKESIMKHCGKGISLSPKNILLRLENGKIKASSAACDCEALNLMPYEINDYQITICSEYEDFTLLKPF
ncbi:4'-phosphopantetheinyl transferase family protein [Butyrivibrio sp. VCB2001]|uniref:4'-phosphopantetheinyl transferase family protein n=1 Tax=Butyrivibrio sp. VCB2001 TaxID=1280667 RepID=UPI0004188E4C|nr:4'-phosphopantetheinyl transferase superfamily protein [Butyrivibrio sp. VCB2001]